MLNENREQEKLRRAGRVVITAKRIQTQDADLLVQTQVRK